MLPTSKKNVLNPVQFFELLFDDRLLRTILRFTNGKGAKLKYHKPQTRRSPLNNFEPFSMIELRKFLELCILTGRKKKNKSKHLKKIMMLLGLMTCVKLMLMRPLVLMLLALKANKALIFSIMLLAIIRQSKLK
ncbi:hypothetical protein PGB90_009891 [Kerria lacca]